MSPRRKRFWMWLAMAFSGATVFQTIGFTSNVGALNGGCREFYTNGIATSLDMCYLLDCENGFLGGFIDPCGDPTTAADDLIVDCSNVATVAEEE